MSDLKGFLLDIDGTLVQDDRPISGALETVSYLQENGYPFLYLTNTTRRSRADISARLTDLGFGASVDQIFHPATAAVNSLKRWKIRRVCLLLPQSARDDFAEFVIDDTDPEYVVMGDLGEAYDYELLNKAFHLVMDGARILALQKNKYWLKEGLLKLDAGPFIQAIEFAAGVRAKVVGKPEKSFFLEAVRRLGLPAAEVAMVGDDPRSDVAGAIKAGLAGYLVRTGKFQGPLPAGLRIGDECLLDSIADLKRLLSRSDA